MNLKNFFTVPNLLSFSRILPFTPLLVLSIIYSDSSWWRIEGQVWFGVIAGLAFVTDYLDGITARRLNKVSQLGKILDPSGDKIIIIAGVITLCLYGYVPVYLVVLIILRDFVILLDAIVIKFFYRIEKITPCRQLGAVTVNVVAITLFICFYFQEVVVDVLVTVSVLFVIASLFDYSLFFLRTIAEIEKFGTVKFNDRIPE